MNITENPIFARWVAERDPGSLWDLYGADGPPAADPTLEHVSQLAEWLGEGSDLPWFLDGWARSKAGLAVLNYETAL